MREKGVFNPHRVASLRSQISQPAGKRETHNPSQTRIGDGGEALRRRNHGGSRSSFAGVGVACRFGTRLGWRWQTSGVVRTKSAHGVAAARGAPGTLGFLAIPKIFKVLGHRALFL
ncbi:hypothetical protein ES288_D04G204600v1 [Gossypium darwinii]|uniref:Uncharacterized protein n=1 Tax=Gossypium darwinii TaxID=34276 RepID=A0A5D2D342_GOSDA|nr:hypothetical protein ES288_D04G204600v1 [Gossypium darwinii]